MKHLLVTLVVACALIAPAQAHSKMSKTENLFSHIQQHQLETIEQIREAPMAQKRELICLALNIYHEARGSTNNDQMAVGFVTVNRLKSGRFGSSICEVVWQRSKGRNGKIVSQFSWTMYGVKRLIPRETLAWRESQRKATLIYSGKEKDITNGATHFHATWMKSTAWSRNVKKVKIGQHFYMKAR